MFSTSNKVVSYPSIGNITYKRNLRARRLSISINNSSGVKVTIPGTLSFRSAESFVLSKSKWIIEKVEYFNSREIKIIRSGEYKTRNHTLNFLPSPNPKISVKIDSLNVNLLYPENLDISNAQVQNAAKKAIEAAYRLEAKAILPQRVEIIAKEVGFKYNKIGIKTYNKSLGQLFCKE